MKKKIILLLFTFLSIFNCIKSMEMGEENLNKKIVNSNLNNEEDAVNCTDYSYKEIVELLINKGADINIKDNYDSTALIWTIYNGNNKEIVGLLIQKGADLNIKDLDGNTALKYASEEGYKEIVELLINKGADINIKNNYGNTALIRAASFGYKEIVELLIKNDADVNIKNNNGSTALISAADNNHKEIVKLLNNQKPPFTPFNREDLIFP